jgi:ATP-dependent DNA ligase
MAASGGGKVSWYGSGAK